MARWGYVAATFRAPGRAAGYRVVFFRPSLERIGTVLLLRRYSDAGYVVVCSLRWLVERRPWETFARSGSSLNRSMYTKCAVDISYFRGWVEVFLAECGSLDGIATIRMVVVVAAAQMMIWRLSHDSRLLFGWYAVSRAKCANRMLACLRPASFRLAPLPAFPFTAYWILCHGGVEMPWRAPPPSTSPWHLCKGENSEVNERRG